MLNLLEYYIFSLFDFDLIFEQFFLLAQAAYFLLILDSYGSLEDDILQLPNFRLEELHLPRVHFPHVLELLGIVVFDFEDDLQPVIAIHPQP